MTDASNCNPGFEEERVGQVMSVDYDDVQSKAAVRQRRLVSRSSPRRRRNIVLADALSRVVPISTEWKLDRRSFLGACRRTSMSPQVDWCATSENHQLSEFVGLVRGREQLR